MWRGENELRLSPRHGSLRPSQFDQPTPLGWQRNCADVWAGISAPFDKAVPIKRIGDARSDRLKPFVCSKTFAILFH